MGEPTKIIGVKSLKGPLIIAIIVAILIFVGAAVAVTVIFG